LNEDQDDTRRYRQSRIALDVHQGRMGRHVVAYEQEVVRARAATYLLEAHEHEHRELDHDCIEVGSNDEEALRCRMEPSVRKGEDEMREHRDRDQAYCKSDGERQRLVGLDERPGEQHEPRADHESACPAFAPPGRGGEPRDDEREAGDDREGGQCRTVAAKLTPVDCDGAQCGAGKGSGADRDDEGM